MAEENIDFPQTDFLNFTCVLHTWTFLNVPPPLTKQK